MGRMRQRARQGDDVGQMQDIAEYRIGLDALGQRARWTAQSARRVSFAERVFQSVRRRIVAAYLHDNLAVSSDHGRRHCMALGFAGLDRRLRNGYRNGGSEVLVFKKLRERRPSDGAGSCDNGDESNPGPLHDDLLP